MHVACSVARWTWCRACLHIINMIHIIVIIMVITVKTGHMPLLM